MRTGLSKRVFGAVGALLLSLGLISVSLTAYLRISQGRGAEPFQNVYGQIETWASASGGAIGGLLLLLGGLCIARWQFWRRSRQEGISTKEIHKELKRNL
jgi:hypothetical protein